MIRLNPYSRLTAIALPVLLGWIMAAVVVWAGWSRSLEARHMDGIRLRADLIGAELRSCRIADPARCGLDAARLLELADGGRYHIDIVDSSARVLAAGAGVDRRYLPDRSAECLIAERDVPGGRVLRVSLPVGSIGARNPVVWGVAGGSVALGSLLPLLLLGWLLRSERSRIAHLVDVARAAERGVRPPEAPSSFVGELEETVRLARSLGAEVRHLRLRLRLEERRLQRFVESLGEGVLVLDDQSRVLLCNRVAWNVLGFSERLGDSLPRAARGRSVFNLSTRLEFLEDFRAAMRREGDAEFDLSVDGRVWRNRISRAPLETGRWGWMVAQFDITASREAEALQNRLVSDVSHEFKTPLTSIRGYAETLFDELDAEDPDSAFQRRSLERILAATTHLEEVVRDLLDLGHLRETGGKLRREELDLGDVIRDAMGTLERQAAEKGVRIVVDLPSGPVRLRGDRGRLVRAMLNLLSNGLKYGAPGEPVRVEVSRTDDSWVVAVIDRGAGIAPEAVSHLFERFFRVDHGRSRDAGGTGLGLAIVREVAKAHGGDATVESKVGEGSVFRLRLPFGSDA